jgi:translation initiation factor IF-1
MNEFHANTFEAIVVAELPQHLYRLEAAHPAGSVLTASLSLDARRMGVHVRTGQRVLVQRASLDPGRGIITGLALRQP